MQAEGYDLEKLIQRVAEIMDMSPEQIMNSGKGRKSVHTRSVLCYWATDQLGITARADIEPKPAISRGKELVKVQSYSLLDA